MQAKWGISVVSQPSSQRAWKSPACVKSMDRPSGSKTTGPVTVFSASVKLTFVSCSVSWGHCLYLGMAPQCLQQIMESQDICFISFITLQTRLTTFGKTLIFWIKMESTGRTECCHLVPSCRHERARGAHPVVAGLWKLMGNQSQTRTLESSVLPFDCFELI